VRDGKTPLCPDCLAARLPDILKRCPPAPRPEVGCQQLPANEVLDD
jgi:hypothetical protein